jgi:hypothetical protein
LLLVPSVVARMGRNVLINPEHAEFPRVTHSLHQPVWWDRRLFRSPAKLRQRRVAAGVAVGAGVLQHSALRIRVSGITR